MNGRYHCEAIQRDYALASPCPDEAVRLYVDRDGTVHGYCPQHTSEGIAEAAREGWESEVEVAA